MFLFTVGKTKYCVQAVTADSARMYSISLTCSFLSTIKYQLLRLPAAAWITAKSREAKQEGAAEV